MNKNNLMDFTPLLDVILILLFAILLNGQVEQSSVETQYTSEISQLNETVNSLSLEVTSLESQIKDANQNLDASDFQKYNALKDHIKIIDVKLTTKDNLLTIDGKSTGIYLLYNDINTLTNRESLVKRIKASINEEIQNKSGFSDYTLITLSEDGTVFRYAYILTEESISELSVEHGLDKTIFIKLK